MKLSLVFAAVLAASADAAAFQKRQNGNPDGTFGTALRRVLLTTCIVSDCGLDAFEGHTAEALRFCSSILKSGTATSTITSVGTTTVTTTKKVTTTVVPPTTSKRPTPTPSPTPKPTPTPTPSPTAPKPSSSTPQPTLSTPKPSSTIVTVPSPYVSNPINKQKKKYLTAP
jgi:hypothetical protein